LKLRKVCIYDITYTRFLHIYRYVYMHVFRATCRWFYGVWHDWDIAWVIWYMVYGCWHMLEAHGLRYILVTYWWCDGHALVYFWGIDIYLRHSFDPWCEAHSWYMYEVNFLVMLVHVEVDLHGVCTWFGDGFGIYVSGSGYNWLMMVCQWQK